MNESDSPVETANPRDLLRDTSPVKWDDISAFERIVGSARATEFRQEVGALEAEIGASSDAPVPTLSRIGMAQFYLGRHKQADGFLSRAPDDAVSNYFRGQVLSSLGHHADAAGCFDQAEKLGFESVECTLRRAGEVRLQGRLEEAETILRSVATEAAGRAEYSFQMGCIWSDRGDTLTAIEYFERAVDMDPHHSRALFRLAAENCNQGIDDEAIRLYEQSLSRPPYYMGALLNLGLLYEDRENYGAAAYCFRRVLDFDPRHERARLYLKDIEATDSMYYDEDTAKQEARLEQLLTRPVTDFELSVRSRNCLAAMNMRTLGDLTRISEQDLLAGKNFGETSLQEIREVMTVHNLTIGQNIHSTGALDSYEPPAHLSPQEQSMLTKPITELSLSVRARKCMARLGISTMGELLQRTPDELLSSRNFGVTSLNEIRSKLAEMNLKLKND